jgi:hypothetical protein
MASGTNVEAVVDNRDSGEGTSSRTRKKPQESTGEDSEDEGMKVILDSGSVAAQFDTPVKWAW